MTRRCIALATALTAGITAACYNFNVTDPNGPTLQGLLTTPTRANVNAAVTGVFARSRSDIENIIWRVGSMGREGINLSGNNQPDYSEPYYGPLSTSQFGGSDWANEYEAIRDADLVIDAAPKAPDMSVAERALAVGVAQTEKALMFMYVIETRANLGAPVDVDRAPNAGPAPFVNEDGVFATIIATLDSARANITAGASASFPFGLPPGYAIANSPATFQQFIWALSAKAWCLRATAAIHDPTGGGAPGSATAYYDSALVAVAASFYSPASANFSTGVFFDFSSNPNDIQNTLSDATTGPTYFADTFNITDAQTQVPSGAPDQRVLNKVVSIESVGDSVPQVLGGIPQLQGWLKFTNYLSNGAPNPAAEIPIIRDEELVLLRAEAEIGTGNLAAAVSDLNSVRTGSGALPAYSGAVTTAALITELLYERRYSLLWEQGTRWIDARRFGLLNTIELGWNQASFPTLPAPALPPVMPVPAAECLARNLGSVCNPLKS